MIRPAIVELVADDDEPIPYALTSVTLSHEVASQIFDALGDPAPHSPAWRAKVALANAMLEQGVPVIVDDGEKHSAKPGPMWAIEGGSS